MNERLRQGSDFTVCVDVSHHVVPESALVRGNDVEIDVVHVIVHLSYCFYGDLRAQLTLGFR